MRIAGLALFALLTLSFNPNLFAATVQKFAVGTCEPNLQSFPTIQSAVNGVPSGAIILVCPGNYPEQVTITQPLTLQGVNIGGSGAAVITVPSGGLVQNATLNNLAFPIGGVQVLAENPGGTVNLTDLVIDGTGGKIPAGFVGGILYQDASGTVSHVVVRHQNTGFISGMAMLVESFLAPQTVTVLNSTMNDFDYAGIYLNADPATRLLTVSLKSNIIRGGSQFAFGIGAGSAAGTVQANLVSEVATALNLFNDSLTITANNLSLGTFNFSEGTVVLDGGTNIFKNNQLDSASQAGIVLSHALSSLPDANVVQSNTISNSSTAVSGCTGDPVTGNTVTGNRIIEANVGVAVYSGNTTAPNTYYGVTTFVSPCGAAPELRNRTSQSQRRPALSFAH